MISQRIEQFGRPLAQVIRDDPLPRGTEVIIRVGHCGVCRRRGSGGSHAIGRAPSNAWP
jgi:D-arabinose 1-dehydrogenase-like Zn-dependent alcohol dehydrogenase